MPTPRKQKIASWSYSRFSDYVQCPALAKFKIVDRLKEPDSKSGFKGTRVHALASVWATKRLPTCDRDNAPFFPELQKLVVAKRIPVELETFKKEFAALRKLPNVMVEQEWAFTVDWDPTGWFDSNAWLRVKVDCHFVDQMKNGRMGGRLTTVHVIDHKTGREYPEHELQRSLYALGAFLQYPDAQQVVVSHWYLDGGTVGGPEVWNSNQLNELKQEWLNRTTAMLNDTTYAPRPNDKCRFCFFRKAPHEGAPNGGPCKF